MNTQAKVFHGEARHGKYTTEYNIWLGIIGRCTVPTSTSYPRYGGRGIKVCSRWLNSYTDFLADMGRRPKGCSIERIDNDGPYTPENCKWATKKEQSRNTRTNRFISAYGKTLTYSEWSERLGGCNSLVHARIRRGWGELEAVTREPRWRKS